MLEIWRRLVENEMSEIPMDLKCNRWRQGFMHLYYIWVNKILGWRENAVQVIEFIATSLTILQFIMGILSWEYIQRGILNHV